MPIPRSIAFRQRAAARRSRRRLLLESLEQRELLATFTVNSLLDTVDADLSDGVAADSEGRTTLRAAVMQANSTSGNDTIVLPAGTIALTLSNPVGFPIEDGSTSGDLDAIFGQITIQGAGQGETILDASALGDRVFETHGTAGFSLFDLTITGGTALQSSPLGGTMINRGRSTLTNVSILDSYAFGVGGAVLNQSVTGQPIANLTISNSEFIGNESDQGGGAITNFSGSVSVFNSTFRDNHGLLDGGAIITQHGNFSVQGSTFENNTVDATNSGGGAISSRTFNALVEANTFQGNEAYTGGAIMAFDKMLIRRNTFVENRSVGHGGALLLPFAAINQAHDVSNNTFSGNIAGGSGGAIWTQAWTTFLNNTVTANIAQGGVGGVDNEFGHSSTRFQNNLIAGNFAEFPTARISSDAAGTLTSLGGNLIGNATGVGGLTQFDDQTGTSAAPINPLLGPLADNGGPTKTHALLAGSPALDRGRNTTALTIDQRGQPRPFNGVFDIGAFESQGIGENNPPVATGQAITLAEDTFSTSGTLSAFDADGDPLVYAIVDQPSHGILTTFNAATGAFTYRPFFDYSGPDSFTFRASDGSANSNLATVTLEVTPVNDAPRPIPIVAEVTTNEDTQVGGQLAAFDPEGHAFTFSTPSEFAPQHGTVTVAADGTWTYTPAAGYYGTDIFGYYVTDELGAAEVGAVEITIVPVNDGPQAADDAYAVDEDGTLVIGAVPISRLQMVSHPGDFIGQGMTWEFDAGSAIFSAERNFDNGVEVVVDPPGVVEQWWLNFAAPGNALLTPQEYANATRFPFQAATEAGLDVSGYGRGHNRLKGSFIVHDIAYGAGDAITRFAASFVQQEHEFDDTLDPPLYGTIVFNSTFGAEGGVLANDADPEGNVLPAAKLVSGPANGILTWNGDGTFTYQPNPNFQGFDTFTYRASDGHAESEVATVRITVGAANDAPVAAGTELATSEDTPAAGQLSASDIDGDALTYAIATPPAHGTVSLNATTGAYTYTPNADYFGPDNFTFRANDGTIDSNVATVLIDVAAANDPPVAAGSELVTGEDTPAAGQLSASDIDDDALTYAIATPPAHGSVSLNATTGAYTYTPNADYFGPDSFTFRANDGTVDSNVATVALTVAAVNDAPTAAGQALTTDEDVAVGGTLAATDVESDPLTYAIVDLPAHGTVSLNATTGEFTYTPNANYFGPDSFTFRASDGSATSNLATVTLIVAAVNDAPVAAGSELATSEDTPAASQLQASDIDGNALTYAIVTPPAHGNVSLNAATGAYTYTPNANYFGPDSFTFQVSDGSADSNVAAVTLSVAAVNDAPTATAQAIETDEDAAVAGTLGATDVESSPLTFVIVDSPAHGSVSLNPATGDYTYTPSADYFGPDSFTFRASDGAADSNVAAVSIVVHGVNDPPAAADDTTATDEDTPLVIAVLANDTDIDADALTPVLVSGPAHGTLVLNPDGTFRYTPAANYFGSDSFTYRVTDGLLESAVAAVAIDVEAVNDAPTAADDVFAALEDTPLAVVLPGVLVNDTDIDGDALAAILASGPSHGSLALAADGSFVYTPDADFSGSDSFTYRASDGAASSNLATVRIEVAAASDAPEAAADSYTVDQDTPLVVAAPGVLANDTDADGDPLSAIVVSGPAAGTLALAADGSFTYTPAAGFTGTDSFTYRASDGTLESDVVTVTLVVEPAATDDGLGKINGIGAIDGGWRSFFINVLGHENRHGTKYSGTFAYLDLKKGIVLASTDITAVRISADGERATVTGTARVNGRSGYEFVVTLEDWGRPGRNGDTIRVEITGPRSYYYDSLDYARNDGQLDAGEIHIRLRDDDDDRNDNRGRCDDYHNDNHGRDKDRDDDRGRGKDRDDDRDRDDRDDDRSRGRNR